VAGVGPSVFGLQQSSIWGWGNPAIEVCIAAGAVILAVFVAVERRTESPLINMHIFSNRAFFVENLVLGIAMMAFIPVFFFASIYGQIALGEKATTASLLILYFFLGFVVCAQIGGQMLDRTGAKRPVVLGCVLAAVGFGFWAGHATNLHVGELGEDRQVGVRRDSRQPQYPQREQGPHSFLSRPNPQRSGWLGGV
jgi:predicted MFS family arabinose efflux permease